MKLKTIKVQNTPGSFKYFNYNCFKQFFFLFYYTNCVSCLCV